MPTTYVIHPRRPHNTITRNDDDSVTIEVGQLCTLTMTPAEWNFFIHVV